MPDILYDIMETEMPFLFELAQELEDTFNVIAYAGHEKNIQYIKDRQEYFKEKYGKFIDHVCLEVAIKHISLAYEILQELLDFDPSPEEIKEDCEGCLQEHLIGGELSEEYKGAFQEFYELYAGI